MIEYILFVLTLWYPTFEEACGLENVENATVIHIWLSNTY